MMKDRNDSNHDDLLDRAVDAVLREPAPDELPPDRVTELVAQVRRAADQRYPNTLIERIKNMRPLTRITVAAAILIAITVLISWLAPNSGTALAFAQVAEALNKLESATWKTETVVKGPDNKTVTWTATNMFLAPSHERTEFAVDGGKTTGISITNGQKDKIITLVPDAKTAVVLQLKDLPKGSPIGRTFQGLRDLVAEAQGGKAGKVERLGAKTIDGRRTEGYRLQLGAVEVKFWADAKTSLPIRVEEATTNPEMRIVMTDFRTGVDLDESLFSVDVPKGYTVRQTTQLDLSKKPIQYLADALKMAAECNHGVFPPELRGEHGIDGIIQHGAAKLAKEKPAEAMKLTADIAGKVGGAFGLLFSLRPENDMHYVGKDVKLGTPNRPIFWFTLGKKSNYQVLYADLSVKEVAAKDAPQTPAEGKSKP
jgi:outer membrane lipoprotein-sorting protein